MADEADVSAPAVDAERDSAVQRVAAQLARTGTLVCVGCGEQISADRRRAAPWATRCIDCQSRHDRERRPHNFRGS